MTAFLFIALVMNVEVEVVSDTSVRVSWDSLDIPEITGYTVYYNQTANRKRPSEESITVPSSDNSVVIEGLLNNVEYQFQVAAIAEVDGDVIVGQRSMHKTTDMVVVMVTDPVPDLGPIIGGVIVFFMAVAAAAIVMALVVYWIRRYV